MTPDREKLRQLAERATSGPWQCLVADDAELLAVMQADAAEVPDRVAGLIFSRTVPGGEGNGQTIATMNARRSTLDQDSANAEYIVAAQPAAVLSLLAEIERVEAEQGLQIEELNGLYGQVHSLRADLAEAKEALGPLVGTLRIALIGTDGVTSVSDGAAVRAVMNVGHLRRAASVHSRLSGEG
jgi:hypothetical protein